MTGRWRGVAWCARRGGSALAAAAIGFLVSGTAGAATIPLGAASGGVAIYYNSTGGEVPTNQAYLRAQFSAGNSNGAEFNFDSTPIPGTGGALSWYGIFQAVPDQFGLDLIVQAPTSNGSVPTPILTAYDNGNNSVGGRIPAGTVTWALSGYTGATDGPADPGNTIINSLFRGGTGASGDGLSNLVISPVSHVGTVFTVTVSGELLTDGFVHWYTISTPDSPVSNFELTGKFLFSGTLSYDSSTDANPLMDFYGGPVQLDAEVICGDRYINAASGQDFFPGPIPNNCRTPGLPCKTIQRTVDVACPGEVVHVAAGTYTEQVTIGKSLTVIGAGASLTTVKAPGVLSGDLNHQNVVTIEGTGVSVDLGGVTVAGPGPSGCGSIQAGVMVRNGADAAIHDNTIADIRDNPLSGCQNGRAILIGDHGLPSTSATATISNNTVVGYQKNGVDLRNGGTFATISNNTITGAGATPLIAQNGVVVVGAAAAVLGNTVGGNECNHPSCGADVFTGDQSTGILVLDPDAAVQVANNDVSSNDIGVYSAAPSTTISGNELSGNRYYGVVLDEGNANVTFNQIDGGNVGVAVVSFTGSSANSSGILTCNRISGAGVGVSLIDGNGSDSNIPTLTAHTNAIDGNGAGINNTTATSVDAKNNWWGCVTGPNTGGCDSASANVAFTPFATFVPPCVSCSSNADCNDGLACTGTETCVSGSCVAGTPVVCTGNQCNDSTCGEPSGTCVTTPKVDGFACNDNDVCTTFDTCQAGVCVGTGGADSDGDGFCDQQEIAAGCDPADPLEVPPQANVYSGGRSATGGEVLLTYNSPNQKRLTYSTAPACGAPGACNLVSHLCTSGAVGDPCHVNSDCNHTNMCRVVINYAASPDLALVQATLRLHHQPKADVSALFAPVSPGCSRKVDIPFPPGFKHGVLRLKATGTTNARLLKDRDVVVVDE